MGTYMHLTPQICFQIFSLFSNEGSKVCFRNKLRRLVLFYPKKLEQAPTRLIKILDPRWTRK